MAAGPLGRQASAINQTLSLVVQPRRHCQALGSDREHSGRESL